MGGGGPLFVELDEILDGETKLSPDWGAIYAKVRFSLVSYSPACSLGGKWSFTPAYAR